MNSFIKLNIFALLYGFFLFIQTELMGNVYRITRITNLSINTVSRAIGITMLTVFLISTIALFFITSKYFNTGKLRYFLTILWIPYYVIFILLSMLLIPITYPGDKVAPVTGLILFCFYFTYPFYIAIINAVCTKNISE